MRAVMKKVLLINANPRAGVALGGALAGYRKLTIGDRHWRIVWRVTGDGVAEIAEVWGVGAREDGEVYAEITERAAAVKDQQVRLSLSEVVRAMDAARALLDRAGPREPLPDWLRQALVNQVGLEPDELAQMTPEEGNARLLQWYSRRPQ